jgi:hypothetical protein
MKNAAQIREVKCAYPPPPQNPKGTETLEDIN